MSQFLKDSVGQWIYDPMIGKMVTAFVVLAVILSFFQYLKRALSSKINDTSHRYRVRKTISFIGYLLSAVVLVSIFSDKLSRLTVVFGVAGAGIAFALQEVIASIAGWFAINFSVFFRPGDRVQLGGIKGDVIDIGLLRTTVMECGGWVDGDLYNGRIVRIANSYVFKEPVFNYSADFEFLWDEITIPVRQNSDTDAVEAILKEIAKEVVGEYSKRAKISWNRVVNKFLIEDAQVEPMISMVVAIDRINFTVRYVTDFKRRRGTKHELSKRIIEQFKKADPPITFAPTALEIDKVPAITLMSPSS